MFDQFDIALDEAGSVVSYAMLLAQLHHMRLDLSVVVSRHSRVQMMFNLKLQAAMEPIHIFWTVNIHCSAQLQMPPLTLNFCRFVRMTVESFHVEVGKRYLDVEHAGNEV